MAAKTPADRLATYRAKRSAQTTPEPMGGEGVGGGPGVFVVQKHAARRLHFDLRLEMHGVLQSWAIPQGPCLDPSVKRLAVQTEDHPLEYVDFEGVIPDGNYGAGEMIIWDRGLWVPLEDADAGMDKGKLLFELRGYKLRGVWTLVRTKGEGKAPSKEWLLIKKPDGFSRTENASSFPPESIISGLTTEELRDGPTRAAELRAELEQLGAPRARLRREDVQPMLCETRDEPFSDDGWVFELKQDGFRLMPMRDGDDVKLIYRRGSDAAATYPDIARVVRALPYASFVLDGEVVVLDDDGRSNFQKLQRRALLTNARDIRRAIYELPAILYVFDLLGFEDFDVRGLPLVERKRLLQRLLPGAGPLRYADHVVGRGEAFYQQVAAMGLEGVVAKRADSKYEGRRSPNWLKLRVDHTDDFCIVGFTRPKGARSGFGALHLGQYDGSTDGGELRYMGRAGSGFRAVDIDAIYAQLDARRRDTPPCVGPLPPGNDHVWVEPELVCEVRYREITDDGLLRQPVFLRLRDDKPPGDCMRRGGLGDRALPEPVAVVDEGAGDRVVNFTNLDKVFWPEDGYTKGDLIDYYRAVSPWLLPYLRDRPVVLTRYPDGIHGKSFYQKDAPPHTAGWLRLERMWSEHAQREIDYFVCDDVESLLYLAQLATIPLHLWHSRVATLAFPDWCLLDLDPKGAPFGDVVTIALAIKRLCDDMEVESFIKTSGSTGLHVLVPLGRQLTYDQSKQLGELMAKVITHELPDIATTTRHVASRNGRVYIDYLQNGHGQLMAGPLSVRPRPGAPVSTPLSWDEVDHELDAMRFTIKTVPDRLDKLGQDPMIRVMDVKPDLARALALLAQRMQQVPT